MRGYWRKPDATHDAIDEQGWFKTGDLGAIDDDGYLFITGRKKDMIITAAGDNIAPVPIEHLLVAAPVIAQAVVIGDDRPHLAALLVPDFDRLGVGGAREDQVRDPRVRQQVDEVVKSVNTLLPLHEKIRSYCLLAHSFLVETGELTPTLKVRRPVIMQRYAEEIEDLYPDED
jgi:long-chain acyl-CoA synthetase